MCTGSANPRVSADMSIDDWRHLLAVALLPHKLFDTSLLLHMENICTNFFLLHLENIACQYFYIWKTFAPKIIACRCPPAPQVVAQCLTHHFSQTSLLHLENICNSNDFSIWKSFTPNITFPCGNNLHQQKSSGKHFQQKSLFQVENICTNKTKTNK